MTKLRHFASLTGAFVLAVTLILNLGTAPASAIPPWHVTTVVTGLQQPRGIAFDGLGAMYVAESGLPGAGSQGLTTGAVDKYTLGSPADRVWSTSFPAAYLTEGGHTDVIGPSGMSAVGSGCTRSSQGSRNGCQILMIMGLSSHEVPGHGFGHLYSLDAVTGAATDKANIGDQNYAWTQLHSDLWEEFPDANPYGVLVTHGGSAASHNTFVVDAGANTVSVVGADGTATVIAYVPNETPVTGLPTRDSTPTCAAQGPDGALYVGTLDLARNFADPAQGHSHVYRIDPRSHEDIFTAAHVWASGLTAITACAFDDAGNFWAAEMFKFNPAGPPGDIVRIAFADPAHPEHIGGGQLPFPGGIAQGPDGAMYVTTFAAGTTTANGSVMHVARD